MVKSYLYLRLKAIGHTSRKRSKQAFMLRYGRIYESRKADRLRSDTVLAYVDQRYRYWFSGTHMTHVQHVEDYFFTPALEPGSEKKIPFARKPGKRLNTYQTVRRVTNRLV